VCKGVGDMTEAGFEGKGRMRLKGNEVKRGRAEGRDFGGGRLPNLSRTLSPFFSRKISED